MKKFGLLGRRLGHSFSPQIHACLGDPDYVLFEKEPEEIENFLKSGEFAALNVTVPYKQAVMPFLDGISDEAERIGAVNTIIRENGRLIGHNTDYYGFFQTVKRAGISVEGRKAVVLGSGGASKTVKTVLTDLGASDVVIVSRTGESNYSNLDRHADAVLLVNATPVGMYPDNYKSPVDLRAFPKCECVIDLIYNPEKTMLIQQALSLGIPAYNGLWMLVAQAKKARELFENKSIDDGEISKVYKKLALESRSIALIGMPGCGKSTTAKLLSAKTGRRILSLDSLIEEKAGISIPQIFASYGEEHFRRIENEVLREASKIPGVIIDCGGGIVTRSENFAPLKQNAFVVFLNRGWENLPTDGRPLSLGGKNRELYTVRLPLYRQFCDAEIDTSELGAEETAEKVMEAFENENSGS